MTEAGWFTAVLFSLDLMIRLGLSARIVLRRLPVGVTLAWLGVVLSFPFFGAVLYVFLGEYRLGRERTRLILEWKEHWTRLAHRLLAEDSADDLETHADHRLSRLAESACSSPRMRGNRLKLLNGADEVFAALLADINAAQTTCDLEYYIWSSGGRVADVEQALVRAAKRGVRCRVLVDAQGSRAFLRHGAAALRREGIDVQVALLSSLLSLPFVRPDLRLHRKIALIDEKVGYAGSLNMADPLSFKQNAGVGQWVDAMVRVEGPAVQALYATFLTTWQVESRKADPPHEVVPELALPTAAGPATVQVVPSGPAIHVDAIERIVVQSIYEARHEVVLTTPYFVPSDPLFAALLSAAESGVKVTLIVPAHVDSRLVQYASRAYQRDLAAAGVNIALYEGGLLHTKSITIDEEISLFGSLNLDPRSMRLNFEITLLVYDKPFTMKLKELQYSYLEKSRSMRAGLKERPLHVRLIEDTARLLGPLL